jgi:2-oxoglutarate dehydrogenase E2 component (dihydrolipoamide succinyltransferase)
MDLKVPSVGESVTEVEVGEWLKQEGDAVARDENVVVLETDKATMEIPAPEDGRLARILKRKGDRVRVGDVLGQLEAGSTSSQPKASAPTKEAPKETPYHEPRTAGAPPHPLLSPAAGRDGGEGVRNGISEESPSEHQDGGRTDKARVMPAAARVMAEKNVPPDQVSPTGPGGRVLKEDAERAAASQAEKAESKPASESVAAAAGEDRMEEVVPMSLMRRKIAERLVKAQQTAALLTTFNEVDMSAVMALRQELQEAFQKRYAIKLGFMSFFVKAVIEALKEIPQVNAEVRGTDIVYRNYFDIGVAIGGGRGLVVPVLRNAGRLSFADIEQAIAEYAKRARENKLRPEDLEGGTFTITNGGVYGSMLSTPLINPPQSGVLGMHAIQDRPVAVQGQVVIRPIMYVALTYDHRIVDGREAVTFLRRVKELIENPSRMLVEV